MLGFSSLRGLGAASLVAMLVACGPSVTLDSGPPGEASTDGDPDDGATSSPPEVTTSPPSTSTSTSSITTSTSTDTTLDGDEGNTFIPIPDGCGVAPEGTSFHCTPLSCDVVLQDCPEGDKCMPWANDGGSEWSDTRCAPVADEPVAPGEVCTVVGSPVSGVDDCELGSMCWSVDPESLQGVCIPFCDPRADACAAPQRCAELGYGSFSVCVSPCNPLDPATCPDDFACRWINDEEFACLPEQGGVVHQSGQHCGELGPGCSPDEACIPQDYAADCAQTECCSAWCNATDPASDGLCAMLHPSYACLGWFVPGRAPAGLEAVGVCAVPGP